jgi:hypothetical protein
MLQINEYISPLVETIEVDAEGVLCGSGVGSDLTVDPWEDGGFDW